MFRRGLVAMTARILLGVAFVATVLVLVACTETTQATASSVSSARASSSSSYACSSSSAKAVVKSKKRHRRDPCGANEILDTCPTDCQSDSCPTEDYTDIRPLCIRPKDCPPPICKCAFNYRRASNGSCIPTKECPPYACGVNEEYNSCPPLCPTDDCSQASPSGECPPHIGRIGIVLPCDPKCTCIKDYWRLNGICVPYGQCPGVCPDNERYSTCTQAECRALNCTQKGQPIACVRMDPQFCKQGCVCKEGYLRNGDGICVLEDKCEGPCGANEILDNCPTDCQSDYCPTEENKEVKQLCINQDVCPPPICKCTFNHRRLSNGSCVPAKECPTAPYACGVNEEYNSCPPLCPTDDCSQASPSGECPPHIGRIGIVLPCDPKCTCIKDYWRLNGICVPYGQCPGVCPDNERYSTCTQAECRVLNCTQKDKPISCVDIDPQYCNKGCVCKEGYLRNDDGICVLEDKCEPTSPCTSANEEFVSCIQGVCRAKDCSEKGQDVPCPDIPREKCDSGCICKEHFLRAANGSCVPEDQCEHPITCGDNEVLDNCSLSCNSDNCPQAADEEQVCTQSDPCLPACKCKFNYKRAKNGTCIPTRDCPPFDCSAKPNEVYVACPPFCPSDECSKARLEGRCPFRIGTFLQCNPKCQCKDGYGRLNGTCVPFDKCPGICPANERYSTCTQAECRALNCTQKDHPIACVRLDPRFCKKGCVCEEGYLRNKDGVCVPEDQCESASPCTSANEEFVSCMQGVCRAKDCSQRGEDVPCPDIPQEKCDSGCICKEHFLRAANGSCVPEDQCDTASLCTSANEEFVSCIQGVCRAKDCSQKGQDVPCPDIPQEKCDSGCICKEHFLRAANGSCVPEDQCDNEVCPDNERYSTCIQATCRARYCTQKGLPVPCVRLDPQFCKKGCVCDEGYLRNKDGICVLEDQCESISPCTSANEEFVSCMQGVCRAKDCSQKGQDVPCPDIPQEKCDSGCICKEHFLRAANGSCVPEDQCDIPMTCGENEVLDNCSLSCNSDNCPQSADEEQVCTQSDPCLPACKCKFNYKRAKNRTCIPTKDCPPFDCSAKPNEEYVACPPFCPSDECGKPRLEGRCPFRIGTFLQCNPKCQCKDGYGRVNGTCVPFDKCPDLCPINEVYSPCVQNVCRQQNCSDRDVTMQSCPSCDEASCKRGCVCQENYYRNESGVCVPYAECKAPKTCGENEILENCPMTCTSDNCPTSADEKQVCTKADPCVPACKCRFNHRRATNGTCIPTTDCPPFDCSAKPNEEFVACPPLCPTDECGKPRLEGRCPFSILILLNCNPKCQCKDGYGRVNGTCVPFDQCPGLCPTNEVYTDCVQKTCRQQKCSDRDLVMETYPSYDEASCKRGCVCQENYYRNDKGVCVSYEECGGPMCPNAHEEYKPDFKECPPNTCNSLVARIRCDENQKVGPGCACSPGYLRLNTTSPCIPICDCPEMKDAPEC